MGIIENIFVDIGYVFIFATIIAFLARKFKQPMIPAYILAGIVIGPLLTKLSMIQSVQSFFSLSGPVILISNSELIKILSEIGIAFLLFVVGLEIDLKKLKDIEKVAGLGAFLQMLICFGIAFFVSLALNFSKIEASYLGFIVAFSSTMVVIKMLSDRRELDTLHGRIIIGMLLIQDIVAILALLLLNSIGSLSFIQLYIITTMSIITVIISAFLSKRVFPPLFKFAAKSRELLLIAALSVCFLFSIALDELGFSIAIGAFVAGITVGNLPYNFEIIAQIKSLRDFFATLFFVSLGMQLSIGYMLKLILPFLAFFLLVVIVKPFVILLIISIFGYKRRTSFLTSISLAQISEFSLILVANGMLLGHISKEVSTLTIMLALATIAASSYFIKFDYKIYSMLSRDLAFLESFSSSSKIEQLPKKVKSEVILCGYNRTGYNIFHKLLKLKKEFFVIEYNPDIIKKLQRQKIPCMYGDVGNPEILDRLDFKAIRFIISTIPDKSVSALIVKKVKQANKSIVTIVTAYYVDEALELYNLGADYVILPHFLGGYHASIVLEEATFNLRKLVRRRNSHIKELHKRRELGHEHPVPQHHS